MLFCLLFRAFYNKIFGVNFCDLHKLNLYRHSIHKPIFKHVQTCTKSVRPHRLLLGLMMFCSLVSRSFSVWPFNLETREVLNLFNCQQHRAFSAEGINFLFMTEVIFVVHVFYYIYIGLFILALHRNIWLTGCSSFSTTIVHVCGCRLYLHKILYSLPLIFFIVENECTLRTCDFKLYV